MNFILINPDEMRAESLGSYGHPLVKTPNLDKLAKDGVRFDQCHVTNTVCTPSRCSMLTGWYPHVRGHRSLWHMLRPEEPNLFKYLSKAGYDIIWYGKNDAFAPETFDGIVDKRLDDVVTEEEWAKINEVKKDSWVSYSKEDPLYYSFLAEEMGSFEETEDYLCIEKAIDFLESSPEKPFCLYLPTELPHPVYHAPEGYHDMYDPDDIPPLRPVCENGKADFHHKIRESRNLDKLEDRDFKEINAKYLGMISYVDALYGRLLDTLEKTGLSDNTTIIFYSDHGDWAGDYGLVEKWPTGLDDTLTRVPLIIKTPDGAKGHLVKECVEHHDIMPTILDLAGIEADHTFFARSLISQIHGETGDPDRAVFAEGGYNLPQDYWCFEGRDDEDLLNKESIYYPKLQVQQENPHTVCRSTMIRTLNYKLIYRTDDLNELYDLEKDPLELNNVYDDKEYQDICKDLEKRILEWYIKTSDAPEWHNHPRW
ncbi:MAG: sulfatase-like hydrolase/transferase [Halanaerobiales bacterium]